MKLAMVVAAFAEALVIERVCDALIEGQLSLGSGPATRHSIARGDAYLATRLHELQLIWRGRFPCLSGGALAGAIETAAASRRLATRDAPKTEVAWSGPKIDGSLVRLMPHVIEDVIVGATQELLVVGYWIVAPPAGNTVISHLVEKMAEASERGVQTTVVLDDSQKGYGESNLQVLRKLWPTVVSFPNVWAWSQLDTGEDFKLHAKLVAADRRDVLVTSANLTMSGMQTNIEVGVRVVGLPAAEITQHFLNLAADGILVRHPDLGKRK